MGLTSRLRNGVQTAWLELYAMIEFVLTAMDHREELGQSMAERRAEGQTRVRAVAEQTGQVLAVVVVGVTALIGILIYGQINSALPQPGNQELANTSDAVTGGFADSMGLVPVILIVAMAGVVLASVQRFRQ